MLNWDLIFTDKYERTYKTYEKKHPDELSAVLINLDAYYYALKQLGNPFLIRSGYIHPEPRGIVAIDQKGGKQKVKLRQTRLYVYPDIEEKILYLLIIGDKNSQKSDIEYCKSFVNEI